MPIYLPELLVNVHSYPVADGHAGKKCHNLAAVCVEGGFCQIQSHIILGSFYYPPNSPTTALNGLNDSLRFIRLQFPSAKIILGGDFT